MGRDKKPTQAERAEIAAAARERRERDRLVALAGTVERPYEPWTESGPLPRPAYGTRADGSPWVDETARRPVVVTEKEILQRVHGGETRGVMYRRGYETKEELRYLSLTEARERPLRPAERLVARFEPMYDGLDFRVAPWGARYSDYEAARAEAVRLINLDSVERRSQGLVTTEGLTQRRTRCEVCAEDAEQLFWDVGLAKFACEFCAPESARELEPLPLPVPGS